MSFVMTQPATGRWVTPAVTRVDGSGWVGMAGLPNASIPADDAIDFGHRLIEAGLAAKRGTASRAMNEKHGNGGRS